MGIDALYDPPFTDLAASGPEDLFAPEAVDRIGEVIRRFGGPVESSAESVAEQRGQVTA